MKRIQSTATQVNTIRRARWTSLRVKGEVKAERAKALSLRQLSGRGMVAEATVVSVVGGSRLERGCAGKDERSARNRPAFMARVKRPKNRRAEVRALIRAEKRGNARGAKEGRKANGVGT